MTKYLFAFYCQLKISWYHGKSWYDHIVGLFKFIHSMTHQSWWPEVLVYCIKVKLDFINNEWENIYLNAKMWHKIPIVQFMQDSFHCLHCLFWASDVYKCISRYVNGYLFCGDKKCVKTILNNIRIFSICMA